MQNLSLRNLNNLCISYELNSPGQNYDRLVQAIKSLGSCVVVQSSFWYVSSKRSCGEAADIVWAAMDPSDSLIVVDATNMDATWYNLSPDVTKHLQDRWFR